MSCKTCDLAVTFAQNSQGFITSLSEVLYLPMLLIFAGVVGLWLSVSGLKIVMGKLNLLDFGHELFFVIVAGGLLAGQQNGLVITVYDAGINTISGASGMVMQAAVKNQGSKEIPGEGGSQQTLNDIHQNAQTSNDLTAPEYKKYRGIVELLATTENGFRFIMNKAKDLYLSFSVGNLTGPLSGLLIMAIWLILILVYFSQVLVTLFRVMVLAGLAPFLLLAVGFGWARGMVWQSLKTLIGAGLALYGATLAIGFCLFSVGQIPAEADFGFGTFFTGHGFTAVLVGFMGIIFVTEATAIANSIAQSQFTNAAAAAMVGGALGGGMALARKAKPFLPPAARGLLDLADKATAAVQNGAGAAGESLRNPNMLGDAGKSLMGDVRNLGKGGYSPKNYGDYLDALRKGGVSRD